MMHWGYGMYGAWFGILIHIAFAIFCIYAVSRLFGNRCGSHNRHNIINDDNSLNILNERYAKGEISDEEYKQKKEIIMKS